MRLSRSGCSLRSALLQSTQMLFGQKTERVRLPEKPQELTGSLFEQELENKEDYTEMAPEVTDSLVLVPRQMYIRRIIRHKFVLKSKFQIENPDRKAFEIAAMPLAPLHKCMADASLLADIIISKYHYHLPFYRVIESYKELGVSISASTINDWFKAVVGKLKPLYDLLRSHVLACDYVQVDESTVPGVRAWPWVC